jgi:acetyl/propionyl-CoA carboxylase alpha subunit
MAATREEAIARMERAIDDYAIAGVETTLPFCRFVMGHPSFPQREVRHPFRARPLQAGVFGTEHDPEAALAAARGGSALCMRSV